MADYNKFNAFFLEDVKNNTTVKIEEEEIVFGNGNVYTYKKLDSNGEPDNSIYRNKVKICEKVVSCKFERVSEITSKKTIIRVNMQIDKFNTSNRYVLKYW